MHLLFGDSHVLHLAPHFGPDFHCESYPGWSSERALRECDWTLEVVLHEATYESCTLMLGANDTHMPTYETLENLLALKRKAEHWVPRVWILGYPDMEQAPAFARVFRQDFLAPPAFDRAQLFGEDLAHLSEPAAQAWAQALRPLIIGTPAIAAC